MKKEWGDETSDCEKEGWSGNIQSEEKRER